MSTCSYCFEMIEEGAKRMDSPCCDLKYHSTCGIQYIASQIFHYNTCVCGTALYNSHSDQNSEGSVEASVEAIRAKPGATNDLKAIRAKGAELSQAHATYTKLQKESHAEFKEAVATHIESIKTFKKTIIDTMRESDELKAVHRITRQLAVLEEKFKTKYDASRSQMRRLLRNRYRRRSLPYALKRRFRILL